ncbi:MAG: hypothetical protein H7330_00915 [Hymenobacteraceae bacterium]|nr:hypothetical protein [Hymenobacteraceae bacterium]
MALLTSWFDWRHRARWQLLGLPLGLLALSGCLESAAPDLTPRQPTLALDFPVGDSLVGRFAVPVTFNGMARTYAGFRSLRIYRQLDARPEELYRDITPAPGTRDVGIGASVSLIGQQRASLRVELVDTFGYRLERTLRARFVNGSPVTLNFDAAAAPRPTSLARGASLNLPLSVFSSGALHALRVYEQVGTSAPLLLRTVAGTEFTHPNNVPILWALPFTYTAPPGVRPGQNITVRFELRAASGLTASLSFTYLLLP